jgi:uncharacterized membrane protein YjjB (DUF3815 family)
VGYFVVWPHEGTQSIYPWELFASLCGLNGRVTFVLLNHSAAQKPILTMLINLLLVGCVFGHLARHEGSQSSIVALKPAIMKLMPQKANKFDQVSSGLASTITMQSKYVSEIAYLKSSSVDMSMVALRPSVNLANLPIITSSECIYGGPISLDPQGPDDCMKA